jgi:hypothetical protein
MTNLGTKILGACVLLETVVVAYVLYDEIRVRRPA